MQEVETLSKRIPTACLNAALESVPRSNVLVAPLLPLSLYTIYFSTYIN